VSAVERILITGAGGLIGAALTRALAARGNHVIAFDRVPSTAVDAAGRVTPIVGDVTDAGSVFAAFAAHRPDAVIHTAAIVGIMPSRQMAGTVVRTNIEGSINVFEAARIVGVRRVVHTSSEEVYGLYPSDVVTEDSVTVPVMPYGATKLAVEHLGRSWRQMHGLDVIHLRISWVYGVDLPRARIPKILVEAAVDGRPTHLPEGGESRIDHTYVDDVVAGIIAACDHERHVHDVYNLATGVAPSVAEMVAVLRDLVPGADLSVGPGALKHTGGFDMPRKGALDSRRASAAFGYAPRFDLRAGLAAYVRAYRERTGRM
jgi:nucleoside-diphosphate-sugar epimerase